MNVESVHVVPIFVTACMYVALGVLWYSPWLFGSLWMQEAQISPGNLRSPWMGLLGGFGIALLMSYVLALFMTWTQAHSMTAGACIGFWIWLGFVATSLFANVLWENKSFKLYLINAAFILLYLVISGAILSFWR